MRFLPAFLISAVLVSGACGTIWFALTYWLKVKRPQRNIAAAILPGLAFTAFLWEDGSLYNPVVGVLFLLPLLALCIVIVLLLDRTVAD